MRLFPLLFLVICGVSGQGFFDSLAKSWSRWTAGRGRSSSLSTTSDDDSKPVNERKVLAKNSFYYFDSYQDGSWSAYIFVFTGCYGVYGCFNATAWPFNNYPEAAEKIEPTYCVYTRLNMTECHVIRFKKTLIHLFLLILIF